MARADLAHSSNAPGDWFVDTRCIRCDAARDWAPDLIGMDAAGRSFVAAQPAGAEQTAAFGGRRRLVRPSQSAIGSSSGSRPGYFLTN